jgi:nickel-dependent lactate racemase
MIIGRGNSEHILSTNEINEIISAGLVTLPAENENVLVIIPDGTRTMPMSMMFNLFQKYLLPRTKKMDFLVALGTHPLMTDLQLSRLVGYEVISGLVGNIHIYNHDWKDLKNFLQIGIIPEGEIREITGGLFAQDVPVRLNKIIFDYDRLIICGPVFPHEVVGFSGGNKYLFPGIAGEEIINFTHWLGAVITNFKVIGSGYTPVRAVIDKAASMVDRPVTCISLVTSHEGIYGAFMGSAQESWQAAAELSAQVHIKYVEHPYKRVISIMPEMYDDLWTAAKGMYKMEPVVADGGEVIIYAPHIHEVSFTHGRLIDQVGYHCRDYFLKQWERFKDYPWGVLAHSTHLSGLGTYDPATGIETPRIHVRLATGIPEERCRRINLGYINPDDVHPKEWQDRESEGVLVIPRAGEMLYRVKENREL